MNTLYQTDWHAPARKRAKGWTETERLTQGNKPYVREGGGGGERDKELNGDRRTRETGRQWDAEKDRSDKDSQTDERRQR